MKLSLKDKRELFLKMINANEILKSGWDNIPKHLQHHALSSTKTMEDCLRQMHEVLVDIQALHAKGKRRCVPYWRRGINELHPYNI